MAHFGDTLKRLRENRGLSQVALAELAGVSGYTISRGESGEEVPWKRSTIVDVFHALERRAPLSEADARAYFTAAGMPKMYEAAVSARERLRAAVAAGAPTPPAARDPREDTAHDWLQRIIDQRGDIDTVLGALSGMAGAWGIPLPPPRSPVNAGPRWVTASYTDGAYQVTLHTPTGTPPRPQPARAQRRTGT